MEYELRHIDVIDRFGGGRLARCLGLPKSTVYSWRQAGVIPAKHHASIMAAAQAEGIELSPADFMAPSGSVGCGVRAGSVHV